MFPKKVAKLVSKIFVLGLLIVLGTRPSHADSVSMYLNGVGGATNSTNAYYIYPYYFNVAGSSTSTPLMCVSFDNEVFIGESWTATRVPITLASSFLAQEDAFLFSQLGQGIYSADDIQEAVWYLSTANKGAITLTALDAALLSNASAAVMAAQKGGYAGFDDGQFSMYIANAGSQTSGWGLPQNYVGLSPTPEPGAIALAATGLLACVALFYWKRRQPVHAAI